MDGFDDTRIEGPGLWAPWTVLGTAALYLRLRWNDLPERWPSHWNAAGEVNGWTSREPASAFAPFLMGAVMITVLWLAGSMQTRVQTRGLTAERMQRLSRAILRWESLSLSGVFAFLGLALPFGWGGTRVILPVVLALVLAPVLWLLPAMKKMGADARASGGDVPRGYKGLYYSDPEDPRLWVPKLVGAGWTVNFGHPLGAIVMVGLVLVPIGLVLVVRLLAR